MTTTAGKPGVRVRERAYKATIIDLQQELERMATSLAGLHATLVTVLVQKGGDVTITPGTMAQMADGKFGFSLIPGPQEGEMTLRVVSEEDITAEEFDRKADLDPTDPEGDLTPYLESPMAEGLQTDPAGEETNGTDTDDHTNDGSDPETSSEV
jgi:hypothetical protein